MAAAAFVLATAALALAAARIAPGDAESLMPQNPNAVSPAAQQQGLNVPSAIIKTNFPEGVNSPRDLAERMEQQARKDIDNGVAVNAKRESTAQVGGGGGGGCEATYHERSAAGRSRAREPLSTARGRRARPRSYKHWGLLPRRPAHPVSRRREHHPTKRVSQARLLLHALRRPATNVLQDGQRIARKTVRRRPKRRFRYARWEGMTRD
jgi:hypothetical protein